MVMKSAQVMDEKVVSNLRRIDVLVDSAQAMEKIDKG